MKKITQLIKQDPLRLEALECLQRLNLPQGYLAAGFVRNLIWDHLHQKSEPTPLNDIDVVYFDANETDTESCSELETQLRSMMPDVKWEVCNQALMHTGNGDQPYLSSLDAMSYWPEQETAVAVRKAGSDEFEYISAFGLECLFQLTITFNPKRERDFFEFRVKSKGWLQQWPHLRITP